MDSTTSFAHSNLDAENRTTGKYTWNACAISAPAGTRALRCLERNRSSFNSNSSRNDSWLSRGKGFKNYSRATAEIVRKYAKTCATARRSQESWSWLGEVKKIDRSHSYSWGCETPGTRWQNYRCWHDARPSSYNLDYEMRCTTFIWRILWLSDAQCTAKGCFRTSWSTSAIRQQRVSVSAWLSFQRCRSIAILYSLTCSDVIWGRHCDTF